MTADEFAQDPFAAVYRELIIVEAAALRAERHLVASPIRIQEARDAVVTSIELLRNMQAILRRATL